MFNFKWIYFYVVCLLTYKQNLQKHNLRKAGINHYEFIKIYLFLFIYFEILFTSFVFV